MATGSFRQPNMVTPTTSSLLDALPTEIQDLIFHYVILDSSTDELKQFRQSNRYFRDRADIHLFRTLHVSASILSLDRVEKVAANDRLNIHVRELVFHRGTFSGHKMVRSLLRGLQARDYGDFEEYIVRGQVLRLPISADLMRVSKCYTAFVEEVESEARFNREMLWQLQLKKSCARFSKLERLTTLSGNEDLDSAYLRRRCGLTHQSWTPNYFAPYEIFAPCGQQFRPKALLMDSVNGEDFAALLTNIRGGPQAINERFSELQELRISFSETISTLEITGSYDHFIEACVNLRSLSLDFKSFYSSKILKDPDSFPQTFIKTALQQTFPKMTHINLTYALMSEHDFTSFLDRHKPTLQTITINRWPIPVTPTGHPTGSIIRALWRIGRLPFPALHDIRFTNELSNTATGDGWTIDNAPYIETWNPTVFSLRRYLLRGGIETLDFPFPISEETFVNAKSARELQELDVLPLKLGFSDYSFEWWDDDTWQARPGLAERPANYDD